MSHNDDGPFMTLADYADRQRAYGAQCMMCRHAKRRGRLPVACQRFPDPEDTQVVLNLILYRLAGSGPCECLERFNAPKDAYMAQDDPGAQTIGDLIQEMAKQARQP